jgi:polysaccharide biosynthesis/export protein
MKKFARKAIKLTAIIMTVAFVLSSCISQRRVMMLRDNSTEATSFENKKAVTYRIQTGDHLYIRIYSVDPKTSKFFQTDLPALMNPTYLYLNSYIVDEQGYINFSFVDKMYVKGLSVEEVKNLVQKTLNDYFKETTVMVRLVNFQVAVLGEVNSPGNFTIDKDQINIFQALGLAGGTKEYANIKKVKLVRQTTKGSEIYMLDLSNKEILQSDYFYLMPNDMLYIQPYKIKSWTFQRFPYEMFLSVGAIALAVMSLSK